MKFTQTVLGCASLAAIGLAAPAAAQMLDPAKPEDAVQIAKRRSITGRAISMAAAPASPTSCCSRAKA
ncbi:MAG: hypothetical protein MUF47_05960 [Porphyrobacter sp.]|nr:hypothetical protein [Porphyrobacter sp.]